MSSPKQDSFKSVDAYCRVLRTKILTPGFSIEMKLLGYRN